MKRTALLVFTVADLDKGPAEIERKWTLKFYISHRIARLAEQA